MRAFFFFFIISLVGAGELFSQDLEKFQYVRVPEKFEFLKHENQFEVNALTAFLFEKYGFEVFYKEGVPPGINSCDVLQADVHSKSGLFRSRLYVTLEDCNNQVVFTTKTGVSREKDFKRSYHEALREAFTSFEELLKNPEVIDPVPQDQVVKKEPTPAEKMIDPTPPAEPAEVVIDPVVTAVERKNVSNDEVAEFINGAVNYKLKRTPEGFAMFREGQIDEFASLIKSGGGDNYLYSSKNITGNAFFDTRGNLVVEYLDPNTQQLVNVIYRPAN